MDFESFTNATSQDLAFFVQDHTNVRLVLAMPSIHDILAEAILEASPRLKGRIVVVVDPTENVFRLGFGTITAIERLQAGGIAVLRREGLRLGCALMDDVALFLAPCAHLVEAESEWSAPRINAVQVQPAQAEAYLRAIAEHPALVFALSGTVQEPTSPPKANHLHLEEMQIVSQGLKEAPPANFPLARQTRVFQAYMQYVEIELNRCSPKRHRYSIPKVLLPLDSSPELHERLEATVALLPESVEEVMKPIRERVDALRKEVAKDLGQPYGRVLLTSSKEGFEVEVKMIRDEIEAARNKISASLQPQLETRKKEIVEFCLPHALKHIPEMLLKLDPQPSREDVKRFVQSHIERTFPIADDLISEMSLSVHYKDLTFETLNKKDFLKKLAIAFPHRDWNKAYQESLAVKAEEPEPNDLLSI